jgi:hypothetical protein
LAEAVVEEVGAAEVEAAVEPTLTAAEAEAAELTSPVVAVRLARRHPRWRALPRRS